MRSRFSPSESLETIPGLASRASDASDASHARILFAVTERDRRLFFPGGKDSLPDGLRALNRWASPSVLKSKAALNELLRQEQPEVIVTGWSTPALEEEWISSPECGLRYVCHLAGTVRHIVPRPFLERGGRVTNWGGAASHAVAEHALLLALASLRNQPAWRRVQVAPDGPPASSLLGTRTLFGRRVGLHGFGRVAQALVNLLSPFNVSLAAFSPGVSPAVMRAHRVEPCASLEALFARSEVLFECEALTPGNEGSVNARVLAALPDGAVFVNVGRGRLVDEAALVREARSGRIHAALDVVHHEPLDPLSGIATVPGVILSPHIAGPTADQLPACGEQALCNLGRYLRGEPMEFEVTLEIYDRST